MKKKESTREIIKEAIKFFHSEKYLKRKSNFAPNCKQIGHNNCVDNECSCKCHSSEVNK
jgi:hypothetical protein